MTLLVKQWLSVYEKLLNFALGTNSEAGTGLPVLRSRRPLVMCYVF
ncbi:hypothetical protein RLON56S_02497 [Alishewanella longhuensis]